MCLNCHVITIAVDIKADPGGMEALRNACKRLGWELKEGQRSHEWYGHWVDDSPTPRHLFATEAEYQKVLAMERDARRAFMTKLLNQCDHAIKVPGYFYEIGVFKVGTKLQLSLDWVGDIGVLRDNNPLPQAYAVEAARLTARNQGQLVHEELLQDGSIRLRVQV